MGKQIADQVYKTPYDESAEGPIAFPDYKGLGACKYHEAGDKRSENPHQFPTRPVRPTGIAESALDFVGNTPLIRLDRLRDTLGLSPDIELMPKCEGYSVGGSVKDRIAMGMIETAEREGRIKPGDVLIEATSGNTGVGLCMAGAIKGYKVIICMPMKMSGEK